MLYIKDIMTTGVITVPPDMTLREAMELFAAKHISGAPVVDEGRLMGVVTSTDLITVASGLPGVPTEQDTESLMVEDVESPDDWSDGDDAPAAYFSDMWVDAGADLAERFGKLESSEWNHLEEHTVVEAMSRTVCALPPETSVEDAAGYMRH